MTMPSWARSLFARTPSRTVGKRKPSPWQKSHPLWVERLEDRLAPATYAEAGALLNLDLNAPNATLGVVSAGTSYTLTLTGDTWSGADTPNVTGNGGSTLTVTAAGLAAVNVTASAAGSAVNFANSGVNAYGDALNVTLDDPAAGAITFTGTTSFSGSAALQASTTNSIAFSGAASVTTAGGNVTLTTGST